MDTVAAETYNTDTLDLPKSKVKKTKKAKKAVKKAKKAVKKAKKAVKKAEKKSRRAFSDADVAKLLSGFKTVKELAKALDVTPPAAQNYVHALAKGRKLETKDVRQGLRGPFAIAYKLAH